MSKKRFEFRLARVLKIRRLEERVARSAWGEAESRTRTAEAHAQTMRSELEEARAELRKNLGGLLRPQNVELAHRLIDRRVTELAQAQASVETLRDQAARLAQAWRERDARKQALERLEERHLGRHRLEALVEEGREMDERAGWRDEEGV